MKICGTVRMPRALDFLRDNELVHRIESRNAFVACNRLHEAGRACDLDLEKLNMSLKKFWPIAKKHGMTPIIAKPISTQKEAWHFDCRGSHDLVYKYYAQGKGSNMLPYEAMAASGILSIGVPVDRFGANQKAAAIQAALIRLGFSLGNLDGQIGQKTRTALTQAGDRELGRADRRAHAVLLRRDLAEPQAHPLPDRRGGQDRPAPW